MLNEGPGLPAPSLNTERTGHKTIDRIKFLFKKPGQAEEPTEMKKLNETKPATPAPSKQADHLVAVSKDGSTIRVAPSQVEQHQRLGWSKVED